MNLIINAITPIIDTPIRVILNASRNSVLEGFLANLNNIVEFLMNSLRPKTSPIYSLKLFLKILILIEPVVGPVSPY